MSDNKDIVALNCPNCKAPLSCNKNEMTVTCEHCGTSVLIKDLVTKSRVNKSDKLQSSITMADNAFDNKDWKSACKYYEAICKIDPSDENMSVYNILMYITGKTAYREDIIKQNRNISIEKRKVLLNAVKSYLEGKRGEETRALARKYKDKKVYKKQARVVFAKYQNMMGPVINEIKNVNPVKCTCGYTVEYNEDSCSSCGKTREQISKEKKEKYAKDKSNQKLLFIALIGMAVGIFFGAGTFSSIIYGSFEPAFLVFTVILTALFVIAVNKKLKDFILEKLPEKIKENEFIVQKGFLIATIAVPVIMMLLLGSCMKSDNTENTKDETATTVITTVTEQETVATTKQTTTTVTTTEKETTTTTQEVTEAETEEVTEAEVVETEKQTREYAINYDTGKFHKPSCYTIEDSVNIGTYEGTKEELEQQGYEPCKKCDPY